MDGQEGSPQDRMPGCLVRVAWMFLGNFALVILAALIASHSQRPFSPSDILFWSVVVLMIALRYVDIRYLKGSTATLQPATMAHWRRYAALVLGVSLFIWALAHLTAHVTR